MFFVFVGAVLGFLTEFFGARRNKVKLTAQNAVIGISVGTAIGFIVWFIAWFLGLIFGIGTEAVAVIGFIIAGIFFWRVLFRSIS